MTVLDSFPDLGFEQRPHRPSIAPALVRIVPGQRQESYYE